MRLNEHWLWLGDPATPAEAGLTIFRAYPGSWWIAVVEEMIGPFEDRSILRAVRVACTPTIDGCELGPNEFGVIELSPRQPLQRGPKWQPVSQDELPQSVTEYDHSALEPVSGCCTTSDAIPQVVWRTTDQWEKYTDESPERSGRLASGWNAHPEGSLLFARGQTLEAGFVIVDLPPSAVENRPASGPPSHDAR